MTPALSMSSKMLMKNAHWGLVMGLWCTFLGSMALGLILSLCVVKSTGNTSDRFSVKMSGYSLISFMTLVCLLSDRSGLISILSRICCICPRSVGFLALRLALAASCALASLLHACPAWV